MPPSTTRTVDVRGPRSAAWVTRSAGTGRAPAAAPLDAVPGSRPGRELSPTVRRVAPARTA